MTAVLPPQIQAQLDEAERIQQQLAQPPAPAEPPPTEDPPPADPQEPVAVAAPAEPPAEPQKDAAYWEHRFKTLEGISRAEKARTEEQLRAQAEQLRQFQTRLESMTRQPPQPAQPETPLVSDKDEDKFGADLIDVARRVSREELRAVTKRLESIESLIKHVAPKAERVTQVEAEVAQSREDRFWSEIEAAVPDWKAVNVDERWIAWLKEYDAVAGRTRQESLVEAQGKLDHRRVVAMFNLFKKGITPPAPQQRKAQTELARQVAPARNSTVTTPPQAAKIYSGADYAYWLDPRRYNDTDHAQVAAMKAELEKAFVEGRIQW